MFGTLGSLRVKITKINSQELFALVAFRQFPEIQ